MSETESQTVPGLCPLSEETRYSRLADPSRRSLQLNLEDGTTYQCPAICDNREMENYSGLRTIYDLKETRMAFDDLLKQLQPDR